MGGTLTRPQRGSRRGPVLAACTAAAGVLALPVLDPTERGHLPTCPFLAVTGWHRPAAVVVLAVLRTLPGLGLLAPG